MPIPVTITTSQLVKWLVGGMATVLFAAGGMYASWIGSTFTAQDRKITDATVELLHTEQDLAVVNAKVDLLLRGLGLEYQGPAFVTHHREGDK